jgi:hypothetical protein
MLWLVTAINCGRRPKSDSTRAPSGGWTRRTWYQLASDQQEARYEGDPWEEVIGPWLERRESTAISEVLEKCISKPQALWTQTDKIRAARCLRAQGWVRYRERQGRRLEWRYRKFG